MHVSMLGCVCVRRYGCMYVCVCMYTTSALAARLRRHITNATSHQACATLHTMMLQIEVTHWGMLASVRERHWWFVFRKYACNNVAPSIGIDGQGSQPRGWLNQRVLAVLQDLREAKQLRDYPRIRYLQQHLRNLSTELSVPLYVLGTIVVPNLLPLQIAAIHRVTRKMVAPVPHPTWEKQAINKAIRVVHSNLKMVHSVCEKSARTFDTLPSRPPCLCHLMHDVPGNKVDVEGHVAFIPIHMTYPDGTVARPNDSLPLPGKRVRQQLFKDLEAMGEKNWCHNAPPAPVFSPDPLVQNRGIMQIRQRLC